MPPSLSCHDAQINYSQQIRSNEYLSELESYQYWTYQLSTEFKRNQTTSDPSQYNFFLRKAGGFVNRERGAQFIFFLPELPTEDRLWELPKNAPFRENTAKTKLLSVGWARGEYHYARAHCFAKPQTTLVDNHHVQTHEACRFCWANSKTAPVLLQLQLSASYSYSQFGANFMAKRIRPIRCFP